MTATALGVVAAVVGPVAALGARSLVQNTIEFPLGLTSVKSDAVSPLPGRLLAETGHAGHLIAVALLVLAGLAVIVSLVVRPPRTVPGGDVAACHRADRDVLNGREPPSHPGGTGPLSRSGWAPG